MAQHFWLGPDRFVPFIVLILFLSNAAFAAKSKGKTAKVGTDCAQTAADMRGSDSLDSTPVILLLEKGDVQDPKYQFVIEVTDFDGSNVEVNLRFRGAGSGTDVISRSLFTGLALRQGATFNCCWIVRDGGEVKLLIEPVIRRKLTEAEIRAIDEEAEKALGDYDPGTDR